MDIHIFDLSNYKNPYSYERKLSTVAYSQKEWKEAVNKFAEGKNLSEEDLPWGEKRNSEKLIEFQSTADELFTKEELSLVPIWLKFNYFENKKPTSDLIEYSWIAFSNYVNDLREANYRGGEQYLYSLLEVSSENIKSKSIPFLSEFGFVNNPVLNIKNTFQSFQQKTNLPIFIEAIESGDDKSILLDRTDSFCDILINSEYFSNSPIDMIFGGRVFGEHNRGTVDIPTVESLCDKFKNKVNISHKDLIVNIFIDRSDFDVWINNRSTFEDKCYHLRSATTFKKKKNYYDDFLNQISDIKKVYEIIVNYKKFQLKLSVEDCKILFHSLMDL